MSVPMGITVSLGRVSRNMESFVATAGRLYTVAIDPKPACGLIERCLAKDPAGRPAPADIVAECRGHTAGRTGEIAQLWLPPGMAAALAEHVAPPAEAGPAATKLAATGPAVTEAAAAERATRPGGPGGPASDGGARRDDAAGLVGRPSAAASGWAASPRWPRSPRW